ncbi:DUF924 family protein [Lacibacterium aquatile]|uniref:DUF924 family protein n=1 Tax=Lacibacterium aquatile TaxID=1168082 RepID=A0ABW5DWJ9_9PROT
MSSSAAIVDFWFDGDPEVQRAKWFTNDPEFDLSIARRFETDIGLAVTGGLAAWEDSPNGTLALILLLDQFPRNAYRGTPRAFMGDSKTVRLSDLALVRGYDRRMTLWQKLFLYLPYEHSEILAEQEKSVALFKALGNPELLDYAVRHYEIIARFGRFPHRNAILERESTPEELAFLEQPGSSF